MIVIHMLIHKMNGNRKSGVPRRLFSIFGGGRKRKASSALPERDVVPEPSSSDTQPSSDSVDYGVPTSESSSLPPVLIQNNPESSVDNVMSSNVSIPPSSLPPVLREINDPMETDDVDPVPVQSFDRVTNKKSRLGTPDFRLPFILWISI